jgi:hypothetical protein
VGGLPLLSDGLPLSPDGKSVSMSLDRRIAKRLSALDPELIERVRYLAVVRI